MEEFLLHTEDSNDVFSRTNGDVASSRFHALVEATVSREDGRIDAVTVWPAPYFM